MSAASTAGPSGARKSLGRIGYRLGPEGPKTCVAGTPGLDTPVAFCTLKACARTNADDGLSTLGEIATAAAWLALAPAEGQFDAAAAALADPAEARDLLAGMVKSGILVTDPGPPIRVIGPTRPSARATTCHQCVAETANDIALRTGNTTVSRACVIEDLLDISAVDKRFALTFETASRLDFVLGNRQDDRGVEAPAAFAAAAAAAAAADSDDELT